MDLINEWLNSDDRHFSIGRAIYKSLGSSEALKQTFENGYSDYNQLLLESELRNIIEGGRETTIEGNKENHIENKASIKINIDSNETEIEEMYRMWKPKKLRVPSRQFEEERTIARIEVKETPKTQRDIAIMVVEKKLTQSWENNDNSKECNIYESVEDREFCNSKRQHDNEGKEKKQCTIPLKKIIKTEYDEYMPLYSKKVMMDF